MKVPNEDQLVCLQFQDLTQQTVPLDSRGHQQNHIVFSEISCILYDSFLFEFELLDSRATEVSAQLPSAKSVGEALEIRLINRRAKSLPTSFRRIRKRTSKRHFRFFPAACF